ncbi:MAG: restriction endonuclease [Elusimicrobia bacterium HGW-Elusimicrobia-1]|jgi:type II restriction enzyme|nr:MAG: restriction endonuclease [Elusimicrobia bacterium HGW-Elusimicrobia-1]
MKYHPIYQERLSCKDPSEVFDYIIRTLKESITRWDYFVNWAKVFKNIKDIEIDLNILNYLVGKENIKAELAVLLKKHPSLVKLIPILVASRENDFKILNKYGYGKFEYADFSFSSGATISQQDIDKAVEFADKTGFLELLSSKRLKNIVDYVIGVEVGLDSNGRKNRTGTMMESIVEFFVADICKRNGFDYLKQADAASVKKKWGLHLTVDKSSRKIDFAARAGKKLYLIETNFYGGGGSKLKSTAGEYKTMFEHWKNDGHGFVWITDGIGWSSTARPLRETFDKIDHLLNLEMVSKGVLEDILAKKI